MELGVCVVWCGFESLIPSVRVLLPEEWECEREFCFPNVYISCVLSAGSLAVIRLHDKFECSESSVSVY